MRNSGNSVHEEAVNCRAYEQRQHWEFLRGLKGGGAQVGSHLEICQADDNRTPPARGEWGGAKSSIKPPRKMFNFLLYPLN